MKRSDIQTLMDAVTSTVAALGVVEQVNGHEPKSAPLNGITAGVWVDRVAPVAKVSGLAATSALIVFTIRLYTSADTEPADLIDPELMGAAVEIMAEFTAGFTLGAPTLSSGQVMDIDLLGAHGTPMAGQAGYVRFERSDTGSNVRRVYTLTLPVVVSDAWTQTA